MSHIVFDDKPTENCVTRQSVAVATDGRVTTSCRVFLTCAIMTSLSVLAGFPDLTSVQIASRFEAMKFEGYKPFR